MENSIKVHASTDQGKTFTLRGTANVPQALRGPDEPMIVERKDKTLWMMVRMQGLGETVSKDGGKTWTLAQKLPIRHPTSRFFLRRLNSGALLLLVKHGPIDQKSGREKLMAFVSDDDGRKWSGGLMIDERDHVTYPDGVQTADGKIYIVYDHNRGVGLPFGLPAVGSAKAGSAGRYAHSKSGTSASDGPAFN